MTAHQRQRVADRGTRVLLALLSAALLALSLPSPDIGWLGWCALVPLLLATQGLRPGQAAVHGLLTGIVAGFGIYGWLFEVPSFDLRQLLCWPSTSGPIRRSGPSPPPGHCGAISLLLAPVLCSVFDYLSRHAGSSHFPGAPWPATQHRNLPLLQIASVIGEHGVTFLVALGNAALAAFCLKQERRPAMVAALVLVTVHVWGAAELFSPASGQSITVAAIQPNIHIGERATEAGRNANLARPSNVIDQRGGIVTSELHRLAGKRNPRRPVRSDGAARSSPAIEQRNRRAAGSRSCRGGKIRHRRQSAHHRTTAVQHRPSVAAGRLRLATLSQAHAGAALPNMCRMPTSFPWPEWFAPR
ncbi:MAG: hypothetical protein U0361_08375 [Nitrospiraceae bacterium]